MSARGWKDLIQDILDAIAEIDSFTRGFDKTAFCNDIKTIRAVELNFIVVGEAASRIDNDIQQAHPQIPWAMMKAMRNRLVHTYFSVDPNILWDTIQNDLPPLNAALSNLVQIP